MFSPSDEISHFESMFWYITLDFGCTTFTNSHSGLDIDTLRPRHYGRHVADDTFKCIFLNENVIHLIKISLKFIPKDAINNIPTLVQIMVWRRPGDKPLPEAMMVSLLTHIWVTRPWWVKGCLLVKSNHIWPSDNWTHRQVVHC